MNSGCHSTPSPAHTQKHTLPPLPPNLSPTSRTTHTPTSLSLFPSPWWLRPQHTCLPLRPPGVRCPRPTQRPFDPTGASHSAPWKVRLLRAPSSPAAPARGRSPAPTRVSAGQQRPSYLRRARRPRRAAEPGGAQRPALGSWPPGGRAGLRGPGADQAAGAAPAALKFPGRGREAQPHRLLKCAVGSNP